VKDDNQENRPRMRYFRYAVFSLTAFVVLSLGFALIPPEPPAPAEPPFSEQARAAALEETLKLRADGQQLAAAGTDGASGTPLDDVVTLLTIQARALLLPADILPADAASGKPAAAATLTATATATASVSAAANASGPASPAPSKAPTPPPSGPPARVTVAGFSAALAASGQQRIKDAGTADGGMARLLGGAGIAQLLAAERLGTQGMGEGTASGSTAPAALPTAGEATAGPPGTAAPTADACPAQPTANGISPGAALAAAAEAELEAVYGYQAALTRLPAERTGPASEFLAQHQDLAEQAEAYSRAHCETPPPQPAGYVLDQQFLAAPAAGLARLEAATLLPYGDIVALSNGTTRAWALSALQGAAGRAQQWGAGPTPVPGLDLDEGLLPQLAE
jgi:Domain of unknown function (DUF4439)